VAGSGWAGEAGVSRGSGDNLIEIHLVVGYMLTKIVASGTVYYTKSH